MKDNTQINAHVMIRKNTTIGKHNTIYSYASINSTPQHIGYKA
ncbi:hypothetical protein [Coxiella endosymbiont of Rhipicephalus microplus]|nr:hypothetical protein [Coxiella-like endosymbiont]